MEEERDRRLRVSGRAVGEYFNLAAATFQRGADAGLFGSSEGGGYDAETVLRLGRRPFVTDAEWRRFDPHSVLLLQQTSLQESTHPTDLSWRPYWGWGVRMTEDEAIKSAAAWWRISPANLRTVRAVVSVVASFVVTIAVVDDRKAVVDEVDGRVRLNIAAATEATPLGRALLRTFDQRRLKPRFGHSFFLPQPASEEVSEASDITDSPLEEQ